MQGNPPPSPPPVGTPFPYYPGAPGMLPRRNWKPIAGAVKMTALALEGVGIIVAGASLGSLVTSINNPSSNQAAAFTSFLNTLEAGIIIAGVGAILLGAALLLDSL